MSSRGKDQTTPHQPLLSSLVIRPTDSGGGGAATGAAPSAEFEPGEVHRDPPRYSRSDRIPNNHGFRMHAGSVSPVRRRNADHRYSPDFDHSRGSPPSRGFGSARDPEHYRHFSPPIGRGKDGSRFFGRPFDGHGSGARQFRSEGMPRNNPNVRPREGDWICPNPSCNNLNFARREHCNNCHRFRHAPVRSPRRNYPGPSLPAPRRFPGPLNDRSPVQGLNGYRSPPRGWARDGPRDFGPGGGPPHPRHDGRFPDHHIRRDRPVYTEDFVRDRSRLERPLQLQWGIRDGRGREGFFSDRRPPSPSPPPMLASQHGRWNRDLRERSRSPIRVVTVPPPKDYRRDVYVDRRRDDRRVMGRERIGDAY